MPSVQEQELEELELLELEELEAQEAAGSTVQANEPIEEEVSSGKALALGAVEAVPFAKDAGAAIETIYEGGLDDFGERFSNNQKEWNDVINKAEEDQPIAFNVGDIGTSVALGLAATPFAVARGAKLGLTAAQIATRTAAVEGGASFLSRSEDRKASDVLVGAAFGGAASKIPAGLKYFNEKLGITQKIRNTAGKSAIMMGQTSTKNIEKLNKHVQQQWSKKGTVEVPEATVAFTENFLAKEVNGKQIFRISATPSSIKSDLSVLMTQSMNTVDDVVSKAQIAMKGKGDDLIDGELLYKELISDTKINKLIKSDVTDVSEAAQNIQNKFKSYFINTNSSITSKVLKNEAGGEFIDEASDRTMGFKKLDLKRLNQMKRDIYEIAGFEKDSVPTTQHQALRTYASNILKKVEAEIEGNLGEGSVKAFQKANRDFGGAKLLQDIAQDTIDSTGTGVVQTAWRNMNHAARFAFFARGVGATAISPVLGPMVVGLEAASKSAKVNSATAHKIKNLQSFISNNSDSPITKQLMYSSAVSFDSFRNTMSSAVSSVAFMNDAQARDIDEVIQRADDMLQSLKIFAPELEAPLREQIKNDNTEGIAQVIDQVGKHPQARQLIKPGIGWNHKGVTRLYSIQDIQAATQQIEESRVSLTQKLMHKKALRDQGIAPVLKPDPKPILNYSKQDKSKPPY